MISVRREFGDRLSLATALAHDVADRLASAVARNDNALLAVSGGTTPTRFLERLSLEPIGWDRVTVTLVDERWVPESSERSNARLVRTHLLRNAAERACFVPLYPDDSAALALGRFDVVVLGMGADGHTASFLPGADTLAAALDPRGTKKVIRLAAPGLEPRLTFSFPALIDSDFIALHIEGEEKAEVLTLALEPGPVERMPIRAFLRDEHPLVVYWAP
ncbi:MAG: 6-phosphogluconolactonase [Hyphomicrobiales bacterium]